MSAQRTIAVITGTRAEFGLLQPVMRAIAQQPQLVLRTIVTGTHLLPPARTIDDIERDFAVDCSVPMQLPLVNGRAADAAALGRGVTGLAGALDMLRPDVVIVLGDRIEALAGALAASISGIRVAHIHGGDRAEGIADESIRHAITKLAHLHFPATEQSRARIIAMGEDPRHVYCVGSPAIDGLADIAPMNEHEYSALGSPALLYLFHPDTSPENTLAHTAALTLQQCMASGPTLALYPNHDPGREIILRAIEQAGCGVCVHLPRARFISLLKRVKAIVGNSSAGLIEAAAIGVPAVNIGPRQRHREHADNVIHVDSPSQEALARAIHAATTREKRAITHPFGDGRAGARVADQLAKLQLASVRVAKQHCDA